MRVAGPFTKFRDHEQPWHISKFDSVREGIIEREPDILSDKPSNEQVPTCPLVCHAGASPRFTLILLRAEQVPGAHLRGLGAGVGRSVRHRGG
jgi:hypothetical protein